MLFLAFSLFTALGLGLGSAQPLDSAEVYSAILQVARSENAGLPVVLATTRSGVECMPHCGAVLRSPDGPASPEPPREESRHSAELLQQLGDRQLIDATCDVPERTFGCPGFAGHLFVALGEIQERPPRGPEPVEGGVWVKVAVLAPCREKCGPANPGEPSHPDAYGLWYLLTRDACGDWTVVRRLPAFFV